MRNEYEDTITVHDIGMDKSVAHSHGYSRTQNRRVDSPALLPHSKASVRTSYETQNLHDIKVPNIAS